MEMPALNTAKKDAKELIIGVLSREHPLNSHRIFRLVEREASLTYPAVYKALQQMERDGMVCKGAEGYGLDPLWLEKVRNFSEGALSDYSGANAVKVEEMREGDSAVFEFDDVTAAPHFWMLEQCGKIFLKTRRPVDAFVQMRRTWSLMMLGKGEYKNFKELFSEGENIAVTHSSRPVDDYLLNIWRKLNYKVKSGVRCYANCETVVLADWLFQLFQPMEIKNKWDEVYDAARLNEGDIVTFHNVGLGMRTKSTVIASRSKRLTDDIRENVRNAVGLG